MNNKYTSKKSLKTNKAHLVQKVEDNMERYNLEPTLVPETDHDLLGFPHSVMAEFHNFATETYRASQFEAIKEIHFDEFEKVMFLVQQLLRE